jgi:dTDP-glucose 4,6-dehydratase
MTRVLVTGGAGFIGSNFVHYLLEKYPDYRIVVLDKLTYAGNLKNLEHALSNPRLQFVRLDVCDAAIAEAVRGCDLAVNFAAETHVDRSIEDDAAFTRTNVEGAWRVAEACRAHHVRRFLQISTDEVYGSLGPTGKFTESTPLAPSSPYAATKAAADLMILSLVRTQGFPAIVTRCSNNYGPYQFPEKFIPLMIVQALDNQRLPLYGDGLHVRDWIHVTDHCRALDAILHHGRDGETYNIGGECERRNLDVARAILRAIGKPESLIEFVSDRPCHDRRYALDSSKLARQLGWRPLENFEDGLAATLLWYQRHSAWLEQTRSGEYRDYFERNYLRRAATPPQTLGIH